MANQKKSNKEYVSAVLFVKLCYVVLTFVSVGNILLCDHLYKSY